MPARNAVAAIPPETRESVPNRGGVAPYRLARAAGVTSAPGGGGVGSAGSETTIGS